MPEPKQTIDQAAAEQHGQADEQQQSPQTPGAAAPGASAGGGSDGANNGDAAGEHDGAHDASDASAELKGDLDELGALAAKRDEYLALAQRTQADFENYRKRVARESALAAQRGVAKLAKELLPAIDNLDRALSAAATDDPLLDGVRLVRSELSAALARVGVESFSPLGETFDPAVHEAVATVPQPAEGGADSGLVVEVYQDGYRLGESVIRPARVVVAA
ncbi:MAG: nucleotide exchange factor GrpE [Solirubrobacteraceae bacterium]